MLAAGLRRRLWQTAWITSKNEMEVTKHKGNPALGGLISTEPHNGIPPGQQCLLTSTSTSGIGVQGEWDAHGASFCVAQCTTKLARSFDKLVTALSQVGFPTPDTTRRREVTRPLRSSWRCQNMAALCPLRIPSRSHSTTCPLQPWLSHSRLLVNIQATSAPHTL